MAMRLVVKGIGIAGRTQKVRPVGSWELDTGNRQRGRRKVSGWSSEATRMGRRVVLWERGTRPETLDGDFWYIRVRWL